MDAWGTAALTVTYCPGDEPSEQVVLQETLVTPVLVGHPQN